MAISKPSLSKGERKFNARLHKAVADHEKKLLNDQLSLPSKLGRLVIVVSNIPSSDSEHPSTEQLHAFHREAEEIAQLRKGYYGGVDIRRQATQDQVYADLGDKEVSDMVLISHGNIGSFWLDTGGYLQWSDMATQTKFLKQGSIEQRMCGYFTRYSTVPLGTFALKDQRQLFAPVGEGIDDLNPDESLFDSVYDKPVNTPGDIIKLIARHGFPQTDMASEYPPEQSA